MLNTWITLSLCSAVISIVTNDNHTVTEPCHGKPFRSRLDGFTREAGREAPSAGVDA
jgi:hypothetical protein